MIEKDQVQKVCASFLMALGAGSAGGFYVAMAGFYVEKFQDRSFVILMLLFFCIPFPVMGLLQHKFDAAFDEKFSTEVTYAFRVIALQLILACTILLWMYLPQTQTNVLGLGFLLGSICSSIISSCLQMTSAISPQYMTTAKMGLQIGGILPIVVFTGIGFNPSSPVVHFQHALLCVVVICLLSTGVLSYFHFTTGLFAKAYDRLAYDLPSSRDDSKLQTVSETSSLVELHGETGETSATYLSEGPSWDRQQTATEPLDPASAQNEKGVPPWVFYWQCSHALVMFLAAYTSSLAGFFGDSALTQELSLLKLGMDLVGRTFATGIPQLPCFADGPWHKTLITNIVVEIMLCSVCFGRLLGAPVSAGVFKLSWCGIFVISIFTNSLIDVTASAYSQVRERKQIARTNQMVLCSGVIAGLLISEATSGHMQRLTARG